MERVQQQLDFPIDKPTDEELRQKFMEDMIGLDMEVEEKMRKALYKHKREWHKSSTPKGKVNQEKRRSKRKAEKRARIKRRARA